MFFSAIFSLTSFSCSSYSFTFHYTCMFDLGDLRVANLKEQQEQEVTELM